MRTGREIVIFCLIVFLLGSSGVAGFGGSSSHLRSKANAAVSSYEDCSGCTNSSFGYGSQSSGIVVVEEPRTTPGECTGAVPNCVGSPCTVSGVIKLLNNTGQNLWFSSGGPGRTKWAPNTVWEHNVGDGDVMPCSGTAWYSIDFYNASSGGTVVYSYVVRCSKCQ